MPIFEEIIPNVTIALGRDLTLPCTVNKLGNYRVSNLNYNHTVCHLQFVTIDLYSRFVSIKIDEVDF